MPDVSPLRNLVYVERVRREQTSGGIVIPQTFDHQHRPSLKYAGIENHFEAKVLAIGPAVRELSPGDRVLVWTFDDSGDFTGRSSQVDDDKLFVSYPDDIMAALDEDA